MHNILRWVVNMITIKRYNDDDRVIWDEFCKNSKNPLFMFERNFMEYHKDRFVDHSLLFYEEEQLVAILPMNENENALFSHAGLTYGGFITNTKMKQGLMNECMLALVDYARDNAFKTILYKAIPHIYHEQPAEEDRYALFTVGAKIAKIEPATVVNLKNPLKMPKGRKAQVSRAKREGVIIKELYEESDFHTFMDLENGVLGKYHDARAVHSGSEMYYLFDNFRNNIHLYGAFLEDEMIAGSIIYEYGQMIHTTYLAANDLARKIGALDLTIVTMLERFKDSKLWFDFGISTEDGGKYLNEGLISQKEGFGGRTTAYDTWLISIEN